MKHIRQHLAKRKDVLENYIHRCIDHKICGNLPINEAVKTPVISTCLSADYLDLKLDRMTNKLFNI
jgi:hypothetical protein